MPNDVYKPARGLFQHVEFEEKGIGEEEEKIPPKIENDISKLDALCLIFGIGLVLFDNSDTNNPQFEIRVRPLRHEPDMFYVNKYMKLIEKELFE